MYSNWAMRMRVCVLEGFGKICSDLLRFVAICWICYFLLEFYGGAGVGDLLRFFRREWGWVLEKTVFCIAFSCLRMFQTGREIFAKAELLSWLNRTPLCLWGLAFPSMKLAFPSSKIAFPSMKFVSLASPGAQKTGRPGVFCRGRRKHRKHPKKQKTDI